MTYKIEVLILPVSDVDRALAFYSEKAGFTLDVDYRPSDDFRVVQLTPPGSACSIQIGVGLTDAAPSSIRGIHTVVEDLRAARDELLERGVEVGDIRHKSPRGDWHGGWDPGLDPERADYASFADFTDPDGNRWVLQERGFRDQPGSAGA
ncbi:MAG TPA: VOC family protein [Solirubrobacteraceae bacterium]|nr:VOC family protein [Solirubrobacteraceae bacterium]